MSATDDSTEGEREEEGDTGPNHCALTVLPQLNDRKMTHSSRGQTNTRWIGGQSYWTGSPSYDSL